MHPVDQRAQQMLGELAGMDARAGAADKQIRTGATARMAAVAQRMNELRPEVLTSADAAMEYQGLVIERARLSQVVMAP